MLTRSSPRPPKDLDTSAVPEAISRPLQPQAAASVHVAVRPLQLLGVELGAGVGPDSGGGAVEDGDLASAGGLPAVVDHLLELLHALVEAVARDGARRLQVPLPPVPQVAQAQLRLQLVGLQRRGQVLCGGGSVRLPTTGGAS